MKLKKLLAATAFTVLAGCAIHPHSLKADDAGATDPGTNAYEQALKGKRVVLIPMAMGFDLAQGWAAYLKHEVEAWGGTFETHDPNWDTNAQAQAITEVISG